MQDGNAKIYLLLFLFIPSSTPAALLHSRKYKVICSPEQRQRYKNDFNAEYSEYRGLHARIEGITRQFTVLDNELKQLQPGTDRYKVDQLAGHVAHLPVFTVSLFSLIEFVCLFLSTDNQ